MEVNKHIVDNLEYYLSLPSPEYAFLLGGDWGVGKTYFIDSFIESKSDEIFKIVKVSLFGLKKSSDINGRIFQELHPVLGSKYARLAGNVVKGAISMGMRIDLNSDGAPDSTLNARFDKVNISDYFSESKVKEIVLVFDDLERSEISTVELLGFINALVETSKAKVILIANESVIFDGDDGKIYNSFKEKVIGKTFEIKHDFDAVLDSFLKGCSFIEYKDSIKYVYNRSGLKNLRKFKQAIDDFKYLISVIDGKYKDNPQFYKDLVRCFFALSIEVKKGSLSEKELRLNSPFTRISDDDKSKKDIYNKYFSEHTHLYSGDVWASILFKGDLCKINEETSQLIFFVEKSAKEIPDWVKLWNFRELEDEEFSVLVGKLEDELKNLNENELRVYIHKVSLIVYFSKNKLCRSSVDDIFSFVRKYICKYKDSESWKSTNLSNGGFFDRLGYAYMGEDDKCFIKLKSLVIDANRKTFEQEEIKREKDKAYSILNFIKTSNLDGIVEVLLDEYRIKPILNDIDPCVFVDSLLDADNKTVEKFRTVILHRYDENTTLDGRPIYFYMKSEIDFWIGVQSEGEKNLVKAQGLHRHLLDLFLNNAVPMVISLLSK